MCAVLLAAVCSVTDDAYAQGAAEPRFAVTGYKVDGDNPLSSAATQSLLAPFTGEAVTIDRLQAAASALETALKDRGYGFLRVIIPPQDACGTITLRVLAFRLNNVKVSGRGQFGGLRWTQRFTPVGAWSHAGEIGLEDRLFENNVTFNGIPIGVDVRSRPLLLRHEGRYEGAGYRLGHALEFAYNLGGGRANDDAGYAGNRAGATADWQAWRYTLQASSSASAARRWCAGWRSARASATAAPW